ncbi:MAG: hypothetical protein BWY19_00599 [bacterium ADurb.Bin212]|nr:MAG: hypothetical protein BWY19_00599 [bacterium ADurb.Bin212]
MDEINNKSRNQNSMFSMIATQFVEQRQRYSKGGHDDTLKGNPTGASPQPTPQPKLSLIPLHVDV